MVPPSPGGHHRPGALARELERSDEVHPQRCAELLGRLVERRHRLACAGVVHQDVDPVVVRERRGDESFRGAVLCQVAHNRMGVAELGRKAVEPFDATRCKHDSCTDRVEYACEAGAETRACTGDDRDLAVEPKCGEGIEHTRNLVAALRRSGFVTTPPPVRPRVVAAAQAA